MSEGLARKHVAVEQSYENLIQECDRSARMIGDCIRLMKESERMSEGYEQRNEGSLQMSRSSAELLFETAS
jgi:hypothetical protein